MLIEILLFLLFVLIAGWLCWRFFGARSSEAHPAAREAAAITPSGAKSPAIGLQEESGNPPKSQLANTSEPENGQGEPVRKAVSFEPDGNFKVGGRSTPESVQAYATKIQRTPSGASNSPAVAGAVAETTLSDPHSESDQWQHIASTDVVSDEEREFVASLLRQIDENNRDISMLSVRVRETDKLRSTVSELQTKLDERERDIAQLTGLPYGVDSPQVQTLSQQLLVRDRELTQLKSSLATLQAEAQDAKQSQANAASASESELVRLQKLERELATSRSQLANLDEALATAQAKALSQAGAELELRRVRSELQVQQQERAAVDLQLKERNQRVLELEARLEGYVTGEDQGDHSSPARTFASGAVANAAARAAAKSTDPKTQTGTIRQLYQPPEECDDLKLIKGIGLKMEQLLNQLGVRTFKQLAGFEQKDIEDVSAELKAFPGRIQRDNWVGQAAKLQQEYYGDNVSA